MGCARFRSVCHSFTDIFNPRLGASVLTTDERQNSVTLRTKSTVAFAVAALASIALAGCAQSSSASTQGNASASPASKTVNVFISGDTNIQGLWQKSLIPAFETANPGYTVNVTLDLHGAHDAQTMAKLTSATAAKQDPGMDLIDGAFIPTASQANLLTTVSTKNLPALSGVSKSVVAAGGTSGIPYRGSSVLLAYDSKTVTNPPKTLDALLAWIKANPGKFAYNSPSTGGSGGSFVSTVLDKYVPAADRAKMTVGAATALESDWTQGFNTLKSLNPYLYQKGVFPNGNQQVLDLLASGQISMAPVWSDMFTTGVTNGAIPASVKSVQISNPSFTGGAAYLGISKTSPHQAAALKLANFVLSPAAQVMIVSQISGFPVIPLDKLPADIVSRFKNADTANLRPPYFAAIGKDMNNQWDQKVPGQ
jgi:putative spermidine/putrescine transport system substrate-binding protein